MIYMSVETHNNDNSHEYTNIDVIFNTKLETQIIMDFKNIFQDFSIKCTKIFRSVFVENEYYIKYNMDIKDSLINNIQKYLITEKITLYKIDDNINIFTINRLDSCESLNNQRYDKFLLNIKNDEFLNNTKTELKNKSISYNYFGGMNKFLKNK